MSGKGFVVRRRIDSNQPAIVQALRKIGCSVQSLASVGHGTPDLLVGHLGHNFLFEVKASERSKLTADESKWESGWRGQVAIVTSPGGAISEVLRLCSGVRS